MYAPIAKRAEQVIVDACWKQWRSLTGEGLALGQRPATTIIDPEALVVASLALRHREQRLRDLLYWWAREGSHLLSVQRLRTVSNVFPEQALDGGVEWFASLALEAGDARWKRVASAARGDEPVRPGKGPKRLQLIDPATLMLRLRAGFGVGAKADLMAFLLGASAARRQGELWTTAHVISEATCYSRASVARAAADMSLARLIEASLDRPTQYSLEWKSWAQVLQLWKHGQPEHLAREGDHEEPFEVPRWRFWAHTYAFAVSVFGWARSASEDEVAPVVLSSTARDLVEEFGRYLAWDGVLLPDARTFPGERYLSPFLEVVDQVMGRMEDAP